MKSISLLILISGFAQQFASTLMAGTTWDGGGANDNWSTIENWTPDGAPPTGATVDLTFDGVTRLNSVNNYTAFDDFHSITFAAGAGSFNLSGSAIDLFGKIENYSTNAQTITMDLAINGGQGGTGEFNPVNGDLIINSTNVFTNGNTLHVYGVNGKTVTFGANTVISQAGHFNVEQASNVVFLGNNTYSGTTNVLAGSLTIGNGGTTGALGSGTVTVASGATLSYNRSDAVTLSQTLNIGGSLVKNGAGTLNVAGAQAGITGTVAINGGRISMGANNSLGSAAITLNGGSLERNSAGQTVTNPISIGAGGGTILGRQVVDDYTTFSGLLSGTGALTIQGLVLLNNTGNTHSGSVTVSNASSTYLRLAASGVLGNSSAITLVGANSYLRLDGGVTETAGSFAGAGNIFVSNVGNGLLGTLNIGGDNSSTSFTGTLSNGDGQLALVKQGTGTLTLTPSSATLTNLIISSGTILGGNNNMGAATITLGDSNTGSNNVAFLTLGSGSSRNITVTSNGSGSATLGSTTGAGAGNVGFSGTITMNRATTLTAASSDRTTWTGKLTGNVGTMTIAGGLRTVFENAAGTNDFVGDVVLSGTGTVLQTGAGTQNGEAIPNNSSITVNTGTILKLANLANTTETINAINGTGIIRRHEGVPGLQTLVIGSANGSGSFGGTLENGGGTLEIRKEGTGTQTISSAAGNTASGGVTVNGGTLKFTGAAGFDGGTFSVAQTYNINNTGTLEIQGDWLTKSTSTYNINAGGKLAFTKTTGDTTINYVNNLNLTNAQVLGPASYRIGNNTSATHNFSGNLGNTISSGVGFVKNGAAQTINFNVADGTADADLTINGVIFDVAGFVGSTFTKTGAGKMVLTASNTYTGPTVISNGTITATNNAAFSTSVITIGDTSSGANPLALLLGNRADISNSITVSANGTGTVVIGAENTGSGANPATLSGQLTLNRPTTLRGAISGDRLAVDGKVTGPAGTITVDGGFRTTFANTANDFTGNIIVTGAGTILQASVGTTSEVIPNSANVQINTGSEFWLASVGGQTETIAGLNGSGIVRSYNLGSLGGTRTLAFGAADANGSFDGVIANGSDPVAIRKIGLGLQSLQGTSTFTGPTTVNAGTLQVGGTAGSLTTTSGINLDGGTLLVSSSAANRIGDSSTFSFGSAAGSRMTLSGNITETVGTLSLSASSTGIIDLGTNSAIWTFANSSAQTWGGVLQVWNWSGNVAVGGGTDQLFFGNTSSGLTLAQASQVEFFSDGGTTSLGTGILLPTGELVPVPEPSAWLAVGGIALIIFQRESRRRKPNVSV